MRLPEPPAALEAAARPVLAAGKNLGLRLSVIGAKTRAAMSLAAEQTRNFIDLSDTNYILPPLKLKSFPTPDAPPPIPGLSDSVSGTALQHPVLGTQPADSPHTTANAGQAADTSATTPASLIGTPFLSV